MYYLRKEDLVPGLETTMIGLLEPEREHDETRVIRQAVIQPVSRRRQEHQENDIQGEQCASERGSAVIGIRTLGKAFRPLLVVLRQIGVMSECHGTEINAL